MSQTLIQSLIATRRIASAAAPAAPTGLASSSVTFNSATISWNASSGATSYRIDVSLLSDFSSFLSGFHNLTVAGTSQSVTGLAAGTGYYVRVRAVNAIGTSANSDLYSFGTLTSLWDQLAGVFSFESESGGQTPSSINPSDVLNVFGPAQVTGNWGFNYDFALGNYLESPDNTLWAYGDFQVSIAFLFQSGNNYGTIIGVWNLTDGSVSQWHVSLFSLDVIFGISNDGGSVDDHDLFGVDGSWHQIVVVLTGTAAKIYIDGTLAITLTTTLNVTSLTPFRIGNDATGSDPFVGGVDEVYSWQRALTDSEVALLYNSGAFLTYPFP